MLTRIVKMTFKSEHVDEFKALMQVNSKRIKAFPGCVYLQILQDQRQPNIFFTYSHWESDAHLQQYRHSALFAEVWPAAKAGFAERAEAWSVDRFIELTEKN